MKVIGKILATRIGKLDEIRLAWKLLVEETVYACAHGWKVKLCEATFLVINLSMKYENDQFYRDYMSPLSTEIVIPHFCQSVVTKPSIYEEGCGIESSVHSQFTMCTALL